MLTSEQRLVLIDRNGNVALHQLVHCQDWLSRPVHGLRTPSLMSARRPTLLRSSQSLPRRYSLGETSPNASFFVIYQLVISQCLNLGIRTRFSGLWIIVFGKPSSSADVFSTM